LTHASAAKPALASGGGIRQLAVLCYAYLTIFAAVKGEVIGVKPFAEIFSAIWRGSAEQAIETESNSMQPIAG